jgi:hypothetical protein
MRGRRSSAGLFVAPAAAAGQCARRDRRGRGGVPGLRALTRRPEPVLRGDVRRRQYTAIPDYPRGLGWQRALPLTAVTMFYSDEVRPGCARPGSAAANAHDADPGGASTDATAAPDAWTQSWVIWGRLGPSKIALISPAASEPIASS